MPSRKTIRVLILCMLGAYWAFMFVMTHLPKPPPIVPLVKDKTIHFLSYGLYGGLLYLAIWSFRPHWRLTGIMVVCSALIYAAFDEVTQPIFGRSMELMDWVADITGATIAAVTLTIAHRIYDAALNRRERSRGFEVAQG
jgi:VanZ family protein